MTSREVSENSPTGQTGLRGNDRRRFRRSQWIMLAAAMFCYLFFYTGRQTFGFAIPGIEAELGIGEAALGLISAGMLWFYAIGQAVNGNLADKFGGRRMMSLGAVLSTAANWLTSFAVGGKSLAAAWSANGYLQAMGWPGGSRVLANWWPHYERGKTYGFYVFAAGLASVLAYVMSTLVIDVWELDWRWIFRLPVLLMLVGGLAFFFIARDRPQDKGFAGLPTEPGQSDDTEATSVTKQGSVARYKTVLRNAKIWSAGVAIGFQNAARYGLLVWVPVHMLGTDWEENGSVISPVWISVGLPVGMAVGAMVNGQISDRVFGGRRSAPIFLFMSAGAVASFAMFLIHPGDLLGVVVLFLTGFLVYGPQASFWALCPDLVGASLAGTATGIVNFFSYLVAGFAEPVIGYAIETSGDTGLVFPIVAGSCVVSALASLTIRR